MITRHAGKELMPFIVEISLNEASEPQDSEGLFFILAAFAEEGIPDQTFAPRITRKFLDGIDCSGVRG